MSPGQTPLVLVMALSLPGAAQALGLGEIHVNSALNEPLAADIEIIGATAEELSSLTASIADQETFLRFGAPRPAFLATATFKLSHDVKGRPVLVIRSSDSFTEPVVNLLVDLRWYNGEVVRQYSLLLDPAGFPAGKQVAAAVNPTVVAAAPLALPAPPPAAVTETLAAAAAPIVSPTVSAAARATRTTTHVKIGAKATLRGVAWRVGARSDTDIQKTMLGIFRANPHAFEGNINRLRRGAVLTIPSAAEISAISPQDASREIRAQMTAWHVLPNKTRSADAPVPSMAASVQGIGAANVSTDTTTSTADASRAPGTAGTEAARTAALNLRVQSLEQGLHDMQGRLEREHDQLLSVQSEVTYAEHAGNNPAAAVPVSRDWLMTSLTAGFALLAGALGAMLLTLRRRAAPKIDPANSSVALNASTVDETPHHAMAVDNAEVDPADAEPAPRKSPRTMPQPLWEDSFDLSAARSYERAEAEARSSGKTSAAVIPEAAAPSKNVITVNEDELRASYEDTIDLSGETAILEEAIAAASGDTASLPATTVSLRAQGLQDAAAMASDGSATVKKLVTAGESATADQCATADKSATANESATAHKSAAVDESTIADDSATVIAGSDELRVDTTELDYNLVDLDQTAHHVQMPSVLHERVVLKERRTSLVDVLKKAVEREPDRSDLRMKLLETYYAAAAANRTAFLEVVEKLARDRDRLAEGEWAKIALMGRQIASDTQLFSGGQEADDDLADCA